MKILLANDDGINAPGIAALAKRFSREHEVYIVAPASNRSGASCSITVNVPLILEEKKSPDLPAVKAYGLSGTPVDCALCGINGEHIPEVDVVISGINYGPNIGTDVIFSGTCGAARYAAMMGIPGIALSVDCDSCRAPEDKSDDLYYDSLADFACLNLEKLISLCGTKNKHGDRYVYDYFVNVNSPCLKVYKGVKLTTPCIRRYFDRIVLEKAEENENSHTDNGTNRMISKCVGEQKCFNDGDENSDYLATENGYVSITPVCTEIKARDLKDLRGIENSFIL